MLVGYRSGENARPAIPHLPGYLTSRIIWKKFMVELFITTPAYTCSSSSSIISEKEERTGTLGPSAQVANGGQKLLV